MPSIEELLSEIEKNDLILIAARWKAICDILDGNEVSDFMLSFHEVRQIADLVDNAEEEVKCCIKLK